ncbi:MAG: acetyltransferase [Bacteroidota bacterium]|nr:acetyltransferase [Bacteroidota bacterium]
MIFVSNNIWLSEVSLNDADELVYCMGNKDIYDNTMRIPFPYSRANAISWLENSILFEKENGFNHNFAIRNQTGKLIGLIGFHFNYGVKADKSEIGYWLSKDYRNQGIMTSVIKIFCQLAKEQYKMKALEAGVFAFNAASQQVLFKAGFTQKERRPEWFKKEGQKIDAVIFAKVL